MEDACTMETGFGALLTREEEVKKNELIIKLSKINVKTIKSGNEIIKKGTNKGNETPIQKEDLNKDNEDWSPNSISSLLDACSHYDKNFTETSKLDMDCVWKEISKEVSGRCEGSKKPKDLEQCKSKFKSMQGRYNREKMAKKFNPNECSSWEWYNTMNSLIGNTQLVANSMDVKSTKQRVSLVNDVLSLKTLCDVNDKNIEKVVIEQSTSRKSPSLDINEKLSYIHKEESFDSKFVEDEKIVQYSNLSTPTTPKSPRSFFKVKWSDSTLPQLSIIGKFKEDQTSQDKISNAKPFESHDEKKGILLVNEIIGKPLNCEERTSNNVSTIDRKGKTTLNFFDSCSDNSSNCFGSNTIDQDSATSSPIVLKSSHSKCMSNKYEDIGSSDKNGEDQYVSRSRSTFNAMELSRSINCNYKRTCIENITNIKRKNENKDVSKEIISKIDESKSHTIPKARVQDQILATSIVRNDDQILATSIVRNDEQMAMSMANIDLEAHSTKMFSKGSSLASLTSQSESSFPSKQKRRLSVSSKYKYERRNQSSRTLMTTLMRATHSLPQFKKRVRPLNRAILAHEPNMVTALMTFGAMIQQLEKNHIVLMERILNEQSNILKDFVKTLKYNHQVREATMVGLVVRLLLSIFLIGVILFGTSKTTSSWMPIGFHSSSWYGKNFDDNFSQLVWVGCFIIVLFTQLLWTSFKRRPITPSHS